MNVIAMFVLGLLMGWLAEWTIDWVYWRGRIRNVAAENTTLQERITALEARKTQPIRSAKNLPLVDKDGNDNFQAIKGIGPIFAKRLKESGVATFEQLSKLSSKQLEEILGTLYKRFYSKQEAIVAQAKEFAKQRAQKN
jgi:predicted flap endonuclease-1-like 5' DNA nuclease